MKDIQCENLINHIFYKDLRVESIRLGSGGYRGAGSKEDVEKEI